MGDKKNNQGLIDKRLQVRLLDRGEVSAEQMDQYLESLPDLAAEVSYVQIGSGARKAEASA